MQYSESRTDKTQQLAKRRATEREEIPDTQHRLLCWVTEWMRSERGGSVEGRGVRARARKQGCGEVSELFLASCMCR